MDRLWAPWRLAYVAAPKADDAPPAGEPSCFLCRAVASSDDRQNLLVHRSGRSVVVLNRFPYNNGHLLIAPTGHHGRPDELADADLLDLQLVLKKMIGVLERVMTPDGFNVGLNLGSAAGAGLPGHLHWHVVPRWNGDTNFMPVFTDAKVMVQSLDASWERLATELGKEPAVR